MSAEIEPVEREVALAREEPWTALVLRMVVHAVGAGVFAWPLTVMDGVVAAAVGAAVGSVNGRMIARSRLRLVSILGIAVGEIAWGPRIGIKVGTESPWRAWVQGHPAVSGTLAPRRES